MAETSPSRTPGGTVNRIMEAVLASLLMSATLLLFVPLQLFLGNFYEFTLTFPVFMIHALVLAGAATVVLSLALLLLPRRPAGVLVAMVAVAGILAWLQSLNPGDYGVFDGRPVDWLCAANRRALRLDLILWIGGALLLAAIFRRSRRMLATLCALALITQLIGAVSQSVTTLASAATPWWNRHTIDNRKQFTFSSSTNVIVLVVDTFQTTLFSQLRDEEPELFTCLDGFTYYPDTVGGFPVTQPSVPLILTGAYYDNSKPFVDYVKDQFEQHSLPAVLKAHGYRSEIYPMVPITVYPTPDSVSNLRPVRFDFRTSRNRAAMAKLLDASLFRTLPQPGKRLVHNDGRGRIRVETQRQKARATVKEAHNADLRFLERMRAEAGVADNGLPTFKFYHLNGIHSPLTLNENLEAEAMNESRGSYRRQAIAMLKITAGFLEKLKEIGAYDSSMIVITADHGFGPIGIYDPARGQKPGEDYYRTDQFVGAALPMLLIKPFGARGALQTSDMAAALSDIPRTICHELDIEGPFEGLALTAPVKPTAETRRRRWYTYSWSWLAGNEYLQPLQEYLIEGHAWRQESWRPSGRVFKPGEVVARVPEPVELGVPYLFGANGKGRHYLEMGWSRGGQAPVVWSTQEYASLGIPVPPSDDNLAVVFHWKPFIVPDKVPVQKVTVYVHDRPVDEFSLTEDEFTTYRLEIPRVQIVNDRIRIAFRIPTAASPAAHGTGAEQRTLGLALRYFTVTAARTSSESSAAAE